MSPEIHDAIIIGGGPAGLTAAIYASRMKMRTLLLESGLPGGRAVYAPIVENFPGFPDGVTGAELADKMVRQATKFGAEIKFSEEVLDLALQEKVKTIVTRETRYKGFGIIIATGTQQKKLSVPGEAELVGRGISYCAVCDGPLFKGKTTVVVGFDDYAFEDALYLSQISKKVIVLTHKEEVEAAKTLVEKTREKPNIEIWSAEVKAIIGNGYVTSVKTRNFRNGKEEVFPVDGVFIILGGVPMTNLVKRAGVVLDERGCIRVDRRQTTNLEGVFAAGDCTCGGMQIVTAAGEGATAAIQAYRHLRNTKE